MLAQLPLLLADHFFLPNIQDTTRDAEGERRRQATPRLFGAVSTDRAVLLRRSAPPTRPVH